MKFLRKTSENVSIVYYLDLTISKDFHNDLNGEDSTMKRLTRMVTYLPTKAITLPVNGSVRILKGSAKQVKKIRNITETIGLGKPPDFFLPKKILELINKRDN